MHPFRMKHSFIPVIWVLGLALLTGAAVQVASSSRSLYAKLRLFSEVLDRIETEDVEEKDPQVLVENAIRGMVSNLDPHTTYMNPQQFEKWSQNFEGYSGIGIYYDVISDKITVLSVIPGGPSDKAGLASGDRIVAINGESAVGMKRDDVPLKLMGSKGSKVEISVERAGWSKPRPYSLLRDEVHIQSVAFAFMVRPQVGYIQIARFAATTAGEFEKALLKLEGEGMRQLILDLRQNGGGYLEAAVQVADKFIPGGKRLVYTKGRVPESFREFFSNEKQTRLALPIVVMIDRATASASEIVAGALQDWDRALIAGETSFGKGLVQSQYKLGDGSALLMTTAHYFTPSGRLIQRPYGDKSFESYYNEIMEDSVRAKWEKDPSRPVHKTMVLQRKMLGGGGITPDVFLAMSVDTLPQPVRRMYYAVQRPFFTFAETYVLGHPELLKADFNAFIRDVKLNSNTLPRFFEHLKEKGVAVTNAEYVRHSDDIQFLLKQAIATKVWGDESGFKVQMLRDKPLLEALGKMPAAQTLLSKAYRIPENRG
jgi:carboxyl-terminal processing protease